MKAELEAIAKRALEELKGAQDLKVLDAVRVKYLGKKGELTAILKQMGKLSAEERPVIGQLANQVRADIDQMLEQTKTDLEAKALDIRLAGETLDVTLPGQKKPLGKKHPLTIVLDELKEIVVGMGFEIATGPEVELDYYNFEALNIPKDHPCQRYPGHLLHQRQCFAAEPRPPRCRSAPWRSKSHPSASSPRAGFTAPTRWTPPTPRCSIRSRVWWWTRASPWPT